MKALKPCPFCGAVPELLPLNNYEICHKIGCYMLRGFIPTRILLGNIDEWETRPKETE